VNGEQRDAKGERKEEGCVRGSARIEARARSRENQRAFCCAICERERIGSDRDACVVRKFLKHVIRQPASSTSGHPLTGREGQSRGERRVEKEGVGHLPVEPAGKSKGEASVFGSAGGGRRWLGGAPFEGSLR